MKKKVLFAVIVSMLGMFPFTGIASTSVKLSIEDFQIAAGEEKEMIIDLSNPSNEITLVQFDMYLPNGLSIKINGGDYDIDMAGRTNWRKHSLEVNFIDGYYRFLLYSGSNALIDGSQGAIIKAKLVANSSFNGGVVELKNILCVNPDQVETKPENVVYEIQSVSAKEKLQITASPSGGEVTKGTKVTLTAKTTTGTAVSGADIYYTLNGTTPTKNSTKYTSAGITINESCTLKAIAYKDGYETSAVIEEKYTVKDETPIISISSFTCQNTTLTQNDKLVVRATIKNTGASYTLKSRLTICTVNENGKLSSKYKGTEISKYISSNGEVTIDYEYSLTYVASGDYVATVMWYRDWGNTDDWGWYYSTKTENRAQFTIKENQHPQLAVTASPSGGEVTKGTKVTLTAKTTTGTVVSGADIYYTLNGTTPTKNSTKYTSAGITINENCTLKAIAYKDGYETSGVLTEDYVVKSTQSHPYIQFVSVICDNNNLSSLTTNDKLVFHATFKNTGSTGQVRTIAALLDTSKQFAYKGVEQTIYMPNGEQTIDYELPLNGVLPGLYYATVLYYDDWNSNSWKRNDKYCISVMVVGRQTLSLSANPASGEVAKGTKVTLTAKITTGTVVSGADIYYTLNGTMPTKNSTKYTSAGITINESCTLKAIAYKDGYETSGVLTEEYTIKEDSQKNGIMAIAAGYDHSLILKKDGTLWACGTNGLGQSGDGTIIETELHSPVKVMRDVASVSAGLSRSLILRNDGTLWACGFNFNGQLGDGTTTDRHSPVKVMNDVASVSAGLSYSLILKNDGTLWACGNNECGQLGDGTTTNRHSPVKVMSDVSLVSAGGLHSLILKNGGTLWACGFNYGRLGDGTTTDRHIPVMVMSDVSLVSAGGLHSLILKNDGTLWACGGNSKGQLGDGTTTNRYNPVIVMSDVSSVSAGWSHSLILKNDGTLWACGDNEYGKLGDGTTTERHSPVKVMSNVALMVARDNHSFILKKDGTLWACGKNNHGQLGDGTTIDKYTPVLIFDGVNWVSSTDIGDVVKTHEIVNTKVFSLSGQRLAAPKKGINIVGGRKVVIK